jgi:hypothetical protein
MQAHLGCRHAGSVPALQHPAARRSPNLLLRPLGRRRGGEAMPVPAPVDAAPTSTAQRCQGSGHCYLRAPAATHPGIPPRRARAAELKARAPVADRRTASGSSGAQPTTRAYAPSRRRGSADPPWPCSPSPSLRPRRPRSPPLAPHVSPAGPCGALHIARTQLRNDSTGRRSVLSSQPITG